MRAVSQSRASRAANQNSHDRSRSQLHSRAARGNVVLQVDLRGSRVVKETEHSRRRIDLAVAAVMAHERARNRAAQPKAMIYVLD